MIIATSKATAFWSVKLSLFVTLLVTESVLSFTLPHSIHASVKSRHFAAVGEVAGTVETAVEPGKSSAQTELDEPGSSGTQDSERIILGARPFPLSMIVGQDAIKRALLLSAVNYRMGGVVIAGGRGTGKSVMARALHQLLPPIEIIKGSAFNIDPAGEFGIDDLLLADIEKSGIPLELRETQVVPCPYVQVPLNVMDDRLIGSADVEESIKVGRTVFSPGLLAKAHRGILYVDDINLLDDEMANILLNVVNEGYVTVEREGVSLRYPCKPLLIATFNPEEGDLRAHFLDRIGVALSADARPLSVQQRVEAVIKVMDFSSSGDQKTDQAEQELKQALALEEDLKVAIMFAREFIHEVKISASQLQYLCEEAIRAGCQGHRAEIFAVEVARASAALEGRQINSDDLRLAVKLAIAPRGTFINMPLDEDDLPQPPPPPPPPSQQTDEQDNEQDDTEEEQEQEEPDEEEDREDTAPDIPDFPLEFMFDVEATPIDPDLLAFALRQRKGLGGGRGRIYSQDRGRYVKPIFPKGKVRRLAVDATLRAAAPYQKARRARAVGTPTESRRIHIERDDVRVKKLARKAGSLIIFVVDASGSMALNRMNAAKGAAINLLTQAYQKRDKISLITFQGDRAEVVLPPTKSITMAHRRLEQLPCGGGSPLAHALQSAMLTGINAKKSSDIGKVIVVLITDGRANVPLCVSLGEMFDPDVDDESKDGIPSRKYLKEEVIALAKKLGRLPEFSLLCIDTESKFLSTGLAKEIATSANGKYHLVAKADGKAIANVANAALNKVKATRGPRR